jgi:tRNA threonylcarbamoyladenosine biosynthesis protein TsaB
MIILAIDTSTHAGGVAILGGGALLASVFEEISSINAGLPSRPANDQFSTTLFQFAELALSSSKLSVAEIDVFAITAGPGSFTGLRVGLAAVKAWSEVYGKPIAPISALEAVAAQSSASNGLVAGFVDARRGQIYGGVYELNEGRVKRVGAELASRPEEFIDSVSKLAQGRPVRFASPSPQIVEEAIKGSSLQNSEVEKVSENLAPWIGRLAFGSAQRGELVDALTLDANYVRRMDAEMYWKDY